MDKLVDRGQDLAERIGQTIIVLATGAIVFGISLISDSTDSVGNSWLVWSWSLHLLTVLIGIAFLLSMVGYYYSPRMRVFNEGKLAKLPPILFLIELILFLLGLGFLTLFALSQGYLCATIA